MRISVQFHRPEILKSDSHPTLKAMFHKNKDDPVESNNNAALRTQALKQQSRSSRKRLFGNLVTISRNSTEMTSLVKAMLVPLPSNEKPLLSKEEWATLQDFDAKRRAGQISGNMPSEKVLHEVNRTAMDKDHACHEYAELLLDIMTRPIDENTPPLKPWTEHYFLSRMVDITGMPSLVKAMLVPSRPGEKPQLNEKAWATLHDFDAKRRAGQISENMPIEKVLHEELNRIAMDKKHACHKNAKLLLNIMTRPIDENTSSLEHYLSKKVEKSLRLFFKEFPQNPDYRVFNSIQPGLVTSTLDYNSIGRTLLFKGATHLIGIPSTPTDKADKLEKNHLDRQGRLQRSIFSFPKQTPEGKPTLALLDFNAMIDPLDDLNVYEPVP